MPTHRRLFEAIDLRSRAGRRFRRLVQEFLAHIPNPTEQQKRWAADLALIHIEKDYLLRDAPGGKLSHHGRVQLLGFLHRQQQFEAALGIKEMPRLRAYSRHHLADLIDAQGHVLNHDG